MQQAISYKDPNGFVIVSERSVYRFVAYSYAKKYEHFIKSELYQNLVEQQLLIPHTENSLTATDRIKYYKILMPEVVTCMSFPYEWCASQWKEVVLSFLKINSIAVERGMILKDATPFNFTFYKGKCIFLDTLSFDFYEEGQPWIGYRQFCETMLGPMALMRFNGISWARLLTASIEGWELSFISHNLPIRSYLNFAVLLHIHWHAKYGNVKKDELLQKNSFNKQKLLFLWQMLYSSVNKWKTTARSNNWAAYYESGIESQVYLEDKIAKVSQWIQNLASDHIVDLGANNGKFSLIASFHAKEVIAVESDPDCIEDLHRVILDSGIINITTVLSDITQPAPGVGWNNKERMPLLERLNCDLLLALAIIHHLCISKNIPLAFIAKLLSDITSKYAVIEFVPKTDPKIQQMLSNREDIFEDYSEEQCIDCFSLYFDLLETHSCASSDRKLFLWAKK